VSHDNKIIWFPYDKNVESWKPSFDFPPKDNPGVTISKIWSDDEGTLFIGTEQSSFYVVQNGAIQKDFPNTWKEMMHLSEEWDKRKLQLKKLQLKMIP
jgi:hypothetical protein